MVEVQVGQDTVTARYLTDSEWMFVAACVAAQVMAAEDEATERRVARIWGILHPEGAV